jgi:hypothetical protein
MKTTSLRAVLLGCALTAILSAPALTHAATVTFDPVSVTLEIDSDPTGGMVRLPVVGLDPPDHRLGQAVRQLTYEPIEPGTGKRVRKLFNLKGITIPEGAEPVSVGFQHADGSINEYLDLTPGLWLANDSNNIDRVTLQCPTGAGDGGTCLDSVRVASLEIEPLDDLAVSARFVALGDTGTGSPGSARDATRRDDVADALKTWCVVHGCHFALLLGDNFYDTGVRSCTDQQFDTKFERLYQHQQSSTEVPIALRIPFYIVLGNHDYGPRMSLPGFVTPGAAPFNWAVSRWEKFYAGYVFSGVNDTATFKSTDPDKDSGCPMSADPKHLFPGWVPVPSGNWVMGDDKRDPLDPEKVPPGKLSPSRYYSFQRGDAQFVALDTTPMVAESWQDIPGDTKADRDKNTTDLMGRQKDYVTKQEDDIKAALLDKNAARQWKIGFGHHPYVSDGDHGNAGNYDGGPLSSCAARSLMPASSNNLWGKGCRLKTFIEDGLCAHGLDLYLSGHDHNLQWLSANCDASAPSRDVQFIVSGAGGQTTPCTHPTDGVPIPARSQFCARRNETMTLGPAKPSEAVFPSSMAERTATLPEGFVYFEIAGPCMKVTIVNARDLNPLTVGKLTKDANGIVTREVGLDVSCSRN